jgi:hypothetical protein
MANSITLAKEYLAILDEVYADSTLTSDLNAPGNKVKPSGRAGSFLVQKLALVGLGNYSRSAGFPAGDAALTWEEKSYTADRGRSFTLDAMDSMEAELEAMTVASEFLRAKVIPEVDAFRFSQIAKTSGITTVTAANLADAAAVVAAWDIAVAAERNAHVQMSNLIGYMSVGCYTKLKNSTTVTRFLTPAQNPSREFETFDGIKIVVVPDDTFYTSIDLEAGATASAAGSYSMTSGAKAINFLLIDKTAVFADVKHALPRLFDPATNQTADAWKMDYRVYHDAWVLDNKVKGIYLHKAA